ncbi:hypothetical protein JOQ06_021354 [Pogonophryne albipinna]|uniref:Uncharacterized protein n=1 Tax=Pogonophryne albipinna TaxID=1090488 RepID=A0AAD6AEH8_9TELE|nr:hypothetical protein JOQ06_021354 [Pogonophryne albipinna]
MSYLRVNWSVVSQQAEPLLGKDRAVVSGLLEVVVILWRSVEKNLKQNEEAKKYMFAKFGNVISKYFHTFEDERCTVPLIQMASLMPPAAVPTFSYGVLSRLRKMESGVTPANFTQLLDCMCSWGQAADVLELVTDWLSEALPQQPEKGNVKRKKVQIMEKIESKPDLALDYLEYLFTHSSTREKVLDLDQRKLTQLHKSVLFSHLSSTADDKSPSVEIALKVFTYHGRLGAHLQQKCPEGRAYLLFLENVAAWIAEEITESFLTLCRDVLLVGFGDEAFKGLILHLCSLTLLSEAGYLCIPAVLLILKEKIIELLARRLRKEPEEGRQLCQSAIPGLSNFLQVAQTWDKPPLSGVFSTLFAVIIVEKIHLLQKIQTGQCKASLKTAASSVQQQLHSHAVTSTDIQRVIYESSVKTLNEILDL